MTRDFKFQFRILTAEFCAWSWLSPHLLLSPAALAPSVPILGSALRLEGPWTPGEALPVPSWTSGHAHWRCYPSLGGWIPERCGARLDMDLGPFGQELLGPGGVIQKGRHGLQVGRSSRWVHGGQKATCCVKRWGLKRNRAGPFKAQAEDAKAVPRDFS